MQPLILLANPDVWFRDSIETVLTQDGFRVITADNGPRTLEQARLHRPDAVILDIAFQPQWPDAYAVCRALRDGPDPIVSAAVPIILTTPGPALRAQQIEALRQGAWDLRGDPLDVEELSLRLRAYVRARHAGDLLDPASGLYNTQGVARRAQELVALAVRQDVPVACVVIVPQIALPDPAAADTLAAAFRRAGRVSDAIGRTGEAEFTIFAPATDAAGAAGLVARLQGAIGNGGFRAGISAADAAPHLSPAELWQRARAALE